MSFIHSITIIHLVLTLFISNYKRISRPEFGVIQILSNSTVTLAFVELLLWNMTSKRFCFVQWEPETEYVVKDPLIRCNFWTPFLKQHHACLSRFPFPQLCLFEHTSLSNLMILINSLPVSPVECEVFKKSILSILFTFVSSVLPHSLAHSYWMNEW